MARKKAGTDVVKAASTSVSTVDELVDEAKAALVQIVELEQAPRDLYVKMADTIINLRRHFTSPGRDFPDWRGRSQEYRMAAARVYEEANIPPDSEGSIQSRIRYNIDLRLREVAPADQLDALGYKKRNAVERQADRRAAAKRGKQPLDTEGPTLVAPGAAPIITRAQAFAAIRHVMETAVWDMPVPTDGPEYIEMMAELVATAKLFEQFWALAEQRRSIRRNTIELASTYAATVSRHPTSREELAGIRDETSHEARYLSAPKPEPLPGAAALDAAAVTD